MAGVGIGLLSKVKGKRQEEKSSFDYEWGSSKVLAGVNLEKLSRSALRNHLEARDLDMTGTKKAMIARLEADLEGERQRNVAYAEELESEFVVKKDIEERGSVYSIGCNGGGQLGLGDTEPRDVFSVIEKTRGLGVVKVAVNGDMCFGLTADHEVLVWGGNGAGPTGIVPDDDDDQYDDQDEAISFAQPRFAHNLGGEEICDIALGASHAVASSVGGDVFSWGHNLCGQLGLTDLKSREKPSILGFFERDTNLKVHAIDAGENHSVALTTSGCVYAWGHVDSGRLGVGVDERYGAKEKYYFPSPTLVGNLNDYRGDDSRNTHQKNTKKISRTVIIPTPAWHIVTQIACGAAHTLAVLGEIGRVFAWGHGAGGRLGLGDCADRFEPTPILDLDGICILQVAAGTWHSAAIAVVPPLIHAGWLYTWGSGYHGQLGQGDRQRCDTPTPVQALLDRQLTAKSVQLGSHHSAMLAMDNELYTWGSNKNRCLGHDIREKYVEYTPIPGHVSGFGAIVGRVGRGMVRAYALGREFTIVATYPYDGPSEDVATKLMEKEALQIEMMKEEEEHRRLLESDSTTVEGTYQPLLEAEQQQYENGSLASPAGSRAADDPKVSSILSKGMRSAKTRLVSSSPISDSDPSFHAGPNSPSMRPSSQRR